MQVIGVVVADTEQHARMAAQRVKIEYEDLPSLISCEDAIKANSFYEVWSVPFKLPLGVGLVLTAVPKLLQEAFIALGAVLFGFPDLVTYSALVARLHGDRLYVKLENAVYQCQW